MQRIFHIMTIHLPDDLGQIIQDAVRAGRYAREEDVIRDALNRLQEDKSSADRKTSKGPRKPPEPRKSLTEADFSALSIPLTAGVIRQSMSTDRRQGLESKSLSPRPSSATAAEMAVYILDGSCLVKRHVRESGSDRIRRLTRVKTGHTLVLPASLPLRSPPRSRDGSEAATCHPPRQGRFWAISAGT